jgi:hypothetical protein
MTRPIWRLMHRLPMYQHCQHDGLEHSIWLEARVVNLPSSVPEGAMPRDRFREGVRGQVAGGLGRGGRRR